MNLFSKNHDLIKKNPQRFIIKPGNCPYVKEYKISPSKSGDYGLQLPTKQKTITVNSLYNPKQDAKNKVAKFESKNEFILVFGSCLGYEAEFLHKKFRKEIIVIEPDKNLFNSMCKIIDLEKYERLKFAVGYHPFELKDKIPQNLSCDLFYNKPRFEIDHDYFNSALRILEGKASFNLSDKWKYKKFTSEKPRALFIDSAYVLTKECLTGLQEAGCETKYIHIDSEQQSYEIFIKNLLTIIAEFRPDFVLTINHLGFDKEGRLTELLSSIEMPFASWFVDSPTVILTSFEQNISDFCNLFIWDKDYIEDLKNIGYKSVNYLPLAALPSIFKPMDVPYRYDVAFVGSSMIFATHKNLKSLIIRPELLSLFEITADKFLSMDSRNPEDAISELEKEGYSFKFDSFEQRADFTAAVTWRATQKYRLSGILKLAEFNPVIHGDPNWDFILDDRFRIEREVLYYQEMPTFYNSAKIQFNMTSRQMRYAVNQRVFDVPASKQFILTDYKEQLEEIFETGKEIICFREVEEIPELVRYYLKNSQEREKTAEAGYKKIIGNHTYKHRLSELINRLRNTYKSSL